MKDIYIYIYIYNSIKVRDACIRSRKVCTFATAALRKRSDDPSQINVELGVICKKVS